ncbi:hypothetical protein T440DRAFT_511572 [Plenodomus tracheiphilus IPT5]|uniref:Uncharacterized protein n=1 Tax=Plenodomus tracheiphilus IPT5 TaxID=1408161 RepID=A0A6A7AS02_9PLEO|nr:hypothetical protein T440DRAFT_511572 [Plenodomus tracheiphilus IPT5]
MVRSLAFRLPHLVKPTTRPFSLLNPSTRTHQNRIYDPIRTPSDLHTLLLLTASSNTPLITLWTASFCSTCASIKPRLTHMLQQEKIGEHEGGLAYAEVQMDSTLIGDLGVRYRISSLPTLMAFERMEAQFDDRLVRAEDMVGERGREWLVGRAIRGGRRGGGGGSMFG